MVKFRLLLLSILIACTSSFARDGSEIPLYTDSSAVVKHTGFTLEYAEEYEQATWVAYVLTMEKGSPIVPKGRVTFVLILM